MLKTKTQQKGLESSSQYFNFKEKALLILSKIQSTHQELQQAKQKGFKDQILEISEIQQSVDEHFKEKKIMYEQMITKINKLSQQSLIEANHKSKIKMQLKTKLQTISKQSEKKMQKVRKQREESQIHVENYLRQKIQILDKKITASFKAEKKQYTDFQQCKNFHSKMMQQVNQFFKLQQKQEQKLKKQTYALLEQCSKMITDNIIGKSQIQLIQYMKVIHIQIDSKIKNMEVQRLKIQQQVLCLMQKIVKSSSLLSI